MKILLLTEGRLIEDDVILSRIPNNYKLDRSVLSKNICTTNFFKYDLIIISFVPSFATPHFKLIELLLRLKKNVVSMNMEQNNFHFDYAFRGNSYKFLCSLGLKLFVVEEKFEDFLIKLNISNSILKNGEFHSSADRESMAYQSNKLIFIFDLRWATATDEYMAYKKRVGYCDQVIRSAKDYSLSYMERIISTHEEIIKTFQFERAYIYFEHLGAFEEIKEKYRVLLSGDIEMVNAQRLSELLLEDSVILTNWHSIELSNSRGGLKIFRINFEFQSAIDYFSRIPHGRSSEEGGPNIVGQKFELLAVRSKPALLDIESIYCGRRNLDAGVLFKSWMSVGFIAGAYHYAKNCLILIAIQLRFFPYTIKTMVKDISPRRQPGA